MQSSECSLSLRDFLKCIHNFSLVAISKSVKERMSNSFVQSDPLGLVISQHLLDEVKQLLMGWALGGHVVLFVNKTKTYN